MTVPASGLTIPSKQLKNVVLPAPFGPMSPTISRSSTSSETSLSAVIPANVFVTPRASSRLIPDSSRRAARRRRPQRFRRGFCELRAGVARVLPPLEPVDPALNRVERLTLLVLEDA